MLAIVGTVPEQNFPLTEGKVTLNGDKICIQDKQISINRGTAALIGAAIKTAQFLNGQMPFAYLIGDIGIGDGSKRLYKHLVSHLGQSDFSVIVFHYLQPDIDWHNRILFAIEEMATKPILIADAGFMYAAKMSGQAEKYDLFTPDIGELAFLSDEIAPHPFYTRGFILHENNHTPDLITRIYKYHNASQCLLVKGSNDYLANCEGIKAIVKEPSVEIMEAIGGTGDTLTGIVSALIESGMSVEKSAVTAAKANRLAGFYANPTPETQVIEIIQQIPKALKKSL